MFDSYLLYLLIVISFIIFSVYLYQIIVVKDKISFDFFDVTELDNKAYWVYNNNLYFADIRQNRIDKDSIKIIDSLNISAKEMEDVIIGANSDYRS